MIESLLNQVFGPSGIMQTHMGYSYRINQHEFAQQYGKYLDGITPSTRVPMMLGEVGTGVGKTFVYLVALAIARSLAKTENHSHGSRALVATYTRSLRDEIIELEPVINHILGYLSLSQITISSFQSITAIASLDMADDIVKKMNSNNPFYQDAIDYRDAIMAKEQNGDIFYITDWLTSGRSFDFCTVGRQGSNDDKILNALSITQNEFTRKVKHLLAFEKFKQDNLNAKYDADIMVVTQTMFILNGMTLGAILSTNSKTIKVWSKKNKHSDEEYMRTIEASMDIFNVVIDEADQFTHQTTTFINTTFSISSITKIYDDAKVAMSKQHRRGYAAIKALIKAFDGYVPPFKNGVSSDIALASQQDIIVEALRPLYIDIINNFVLDHQYRGHLFVDRAAIVAESIRKIISFRDLVCDNSMEAAVLDKSRVKLAVMKTNPNGIVDYELSLAATKGSHLVSRPWRNYNSHNFSSIALISGTMVDEKSSMDSFQRMVGIHSNRDIIAARVVIPTTGRLDRIVYCDGPRDIWNKNEKIDLQSENNQTTVGMLPVYEKHMLDVIRSATADKPALILMTSYSKMNMLSAHLPLGNFVIQHNGERSIEFINRLKNQPQSSAICMFWSGANFVHNGTTMFDRVVIPILPFTPLPSEHGSYSQFSNLHIEAYWKLKQGMGRIFRNPSDIHGEVWIGDPRYKLPSSHASAFHLPYHGGVKSFDSLFDQMIKPRITEICRWSKGAITHRAIVK